VDPGVGHQVRLELGEIHVQGAVEPQRGRNRGDDLTDQTIQVGVRRSLDVQVPARTNWFESPNLRNKKGRGIYFYILSCYDMSCGDRLHLNV